MNLRLIHPGSAGKGPLAKAVADYRGRLDRMLRTEETFVRAVKHGPRERALAEEADRIRKSLRERERVVALSIQATPWSSERVAERLDAWMHMGLSGVAFLLGSADGLDADLTREADEQWAFGPMTLPHDLARVLLWEQLYRGVAILRNLPYHH